MYSFGCTDKFLQRSHRNDKNPICLCASFRYLEQITEHIFLHIQCELPTVAKDRSSLNFIYLMTISKQVLQLISMFVFGSDFGVEALIWEKTRVSGWDSSAQAGNHNTLSQTSTVHPENRSRIAVLRSQYVNRYATQFQIFKYYQ